MEDYSSTHRAARLRGLRFLAEHALAAGDAYALHVDVDVVGQVSIQGEEGSLQRLIRLVDAVKQDRAPEDQWQTWQGSVAFDGGVVTEADPWPRPVAEPGARSTVS